MGAPRSHTERFSAELQQWMELLAERPRPTVRVPARCPTDHHLGAPSPSQSFEVRWRDHNLGVVHQHSLLHLVMQGAFSDPGQPPSFRDITLRDEGELEFSSPMSHPSWAALWETSRADAQRKYATPAFSCDIGDEGLLPVLLGLHPTDTGWLKVQEPGKVRILSIVEGDICSCLSTVDSEDLLSILVDTERVSDAQLARAIVKSGPTQVLRGLVRTGAMSKDQLPAVRADVTFERVLRAVTARQGAVRFDRDETARLAASQPPLSTADVVRAAVMRASTPNLQRALGGRYARLKACAKSADPLLWTSPDDAHGALGVLEDGVVQGAQGGISVRDLQERLTQQGATRANVLRAIWAQQLMGTVARMR